MAVQRVFSELVSEFPDNREKYREYLEISGCISGVVGDIFIKLSDL